MMEVERGERREEKEKTHIVKSIFVFHMEYYNSDIILCGDKL